MVSWILEPVSLVGVLDGVPDQVVEESCEIEMLGMLEGSGTGFSARV